jgi:rubrerythrin
MRAMSEFDRADPSVIADEYSGFPVQTQPRFGHRPGTIEWLLDAVERHAKAEQQALDQYEYIGSTSGDPVIALVMRLILEDEERHHGLLKRMQASLSDALYWTDSPEALPKTGTPSQAVASDLAKTVHELVEEEHTGARYVQQLAREQKGIDGGLHSLLLDMMAMDSEKHARLLQFVQHRLNQREKVRSQVVSAND